MRMIFGRTDIELFVKGDLDVGHAAMLHHGSHRVHGDGVRGCQADFLHVRLQDSLRIDWSRPSFHFFSTWIFWIVSSEKSYSGQRASNTWTFSAVCLFLFSVDVPLIVFWQPPTHHDAEGFLHHINDGCLGFLPGLGPSALVDVRLHLHQGLRGKIMRLLFWFWVDL